MSTAPFPIDPHRTAMAIAYRNPVLIGDSVLPRSPVGKQEFSYQSYPLAENFTVPDSLVGRKSAPNQIDFTATEDTGKTEDYGYDDLIPQNDIDNAPQGYDPVDRAVLGLSDLIALGREKRVADLVTTLANYPSTNRVTLSGTDQWSDFVNSDPLDDIMTGLDAMLMRANKAVFGRASWSKFCRHPKIVKAVHGNAGDSGIATRRAVADLLEVEEVLVGEGWLNTAKKGQTASLSRVWGGHCALLYINPHASTQGGLTFGLTPEFGNRIAGTMPDPTVGLRGSQRVRVGESLTEKIVAGYAGYLIRDAV